MGAPGVIAPASSRRLSVHIRGRVQGVGFRPFVSGLAARQGMAGFGPNDTEGELIAAEGADAEAILAAIRAEAPTPAHITAVEATSRPPTSEAGSAIRQSATAGPARGTAPLHGTLAAGLAALVADRLPAGETRLALTGGCAANRLLSETLARLLSARGIALILPRLARSATAACRLTRRRSPAAS